MPRRWTRTLVGAAGVVVAIVVATTAAAVVSRHGQVRSSVNVLASPTLIEGSVQLDPPPDGTIPAVTQDQALQIANSQIAGASDYPEVATLLLLTDQGRTNIP